MFVYILISAICVFFAWLHHTYTTLSRRGIRHTSIVPLLGDMAGVTFMKEHIVDVITRAYDNYPEDRLVGRYDLLTPYIIVKDLKVLKRILVTDFEYFAERRNTVDPKADPLFGRIIFLLRGEEWKSMRAATRPAFTSSKIRLMMPFMVQVADQAIAALKTRIERSKDNHLDLQARDLTTRYANDVVATCVFGFDVNSNEENEFMKMCKQLVTIDTGFRMRFLGFKIVPWIMSALQLTMFSKKATDYFSNVVLGAIKQREEQNIYRPDMIHLLMEAKTGKLAQISTTRKDDNAGFDTVEESNVETVKNKAVWTDIDLVAQAVNFIFAGYDNVASVLAFLLYELAINPDCQERLVHEILENHERNNGKFDFASVQHMTYLDMVISESLRKWPGSVAQDRICLKDYNLGKPNDQATKDVIIRKGEAIQIPTHVYHRDPKLFPDPEKFDPERFSEQNKHKIDPFAYMPFGLGPRNCIASRFVLCELKVFVFHLMLHMEVAPCEKTIIPITLSPKDGFRMTVTGGNWLRFRPRKN